MVKTGISSEADGFAQRLRQALTAAGVALSPTVVAHEFNLRYWGKSITVHAARNWLLGVSLPKQDKLRVLAHWLQVSPESLLLGNLAGDLSKPRVGENHLLDTLNMADLHMLQTYMALSPHNRRTVREVVAAFYALDSQPKNDKKQDG